MTPSEIIMEAMGGMDSPPPEETAAEVRRKMLGDKAANELANQQGLPGVEDAGPMARIRAIQRQNPALPQQMQVAPPPLQQPPQQETPGDEELVDNPNLDLLDINQTGRGQLQRMMSQNGIMGGNFQPVLQGDELKKILETNQQRLDSLYEKASQSPSDLTRQEMERRFGRGWGGFGKRFLTEMLLGMSGEGGGVTGRMMKRYQEEQSQAMDLFKTLQSNQSAMLQSARSTDSTYAKLISDEAKQRIAAFNALSQDKNRTDRVRLTQDLQDAQIKAINANIPLAQARQQFLQQQIALMQKTGNTTLDTAESFGKAYAENAMANDPGFAQEYQTAPNDPSKWSPKLFNAYQSAFKQGLLDYMKAKAASQPQGSQRTVSQIIASPTTGYFDKTGRFVNTIIVAQKTPTGGVTIRHLDMAGSPLDASLYGTQNSKDRMDKVNQLNTNIDVMGSAFDQVAPLGDKERSSNFGIIAGHPFIVELKKSGILPGLDNIKDLASLNNVLAASKNWVNYLYTYSGKVVNEREMQAIKSFIPNLSSTASVYEAMSALSYYMGMLGRAQYMSSPNGLLKVSPGENYADTLRKATLISLKSAASARKHIPGAKVIRLDSHGEGGDQLALLHAGKLDELAKSLGIARATLDYLMKE